MTTEEKPKRRRRVQPAGLDDIPEAVAAETGGVTHEEPETVEGDYTESAPETQQAVPDPQTDPQNLPAVRTPATPTGFDPGTQALAMLSDDEFETRLEMLKKGRQRIATIQKELLVVDVDYGIIPGTDDRHTLFKAGAEKLCQFYGLVSRIEVVARIGDNVTAPAVRYDATCFIHLGSTEGPVVATGYGTANSWEKRYLRPSTPCPSCGKPALMKSKFGPGMYCNPKAGGCGSNIPMNEVPPSDPKGEVTTAHDLGNTLAKMAEKRAHVDATLRATATSGLFTQDVVEDENSDTQLDAGTSVDEASQEAVRPSGATVDVSTGEVVRAESQDAAMMEAVAPGADTLPEDPLAELGEEIARDDAEQRAKTARQATIAELAAAGNAVDPKTGKIDAAVSGDPEPEFAPSDVEGVGRGGITNGSNEPQLATVKRISKENGLGPSGLITFMKDHGALDPKIAEAMLQIPDKKGQANALAARLERLNGQQVGKLIHDMRETFEAAS